MKIFIAVLAIIAAVSAEEEWAPKSIEQIKELRAKCLEENPIPSELANNPKGLEDSELESVHKYILCGVKSLGIFCEHEGYHPERVVKQLGSKSDDAEALEIVKGCSDKNEQKSSVEEWAFRGHQCLWKSKLGEKLRELYKKVHGEN